MRHCTVVLKSTSIQLHFLIVVFLMHYCVLYHIHRGQNSPKIVATGQIRLNLDIIMCEFFPSIENMQLRFLSFPFCPTSCSSSNNAHLTGILHLTNILHLPIPHRFYLDPLARTETICWGTKVLKLSDASYLPNDTDSTWSDAENNQLSICKCYWKPKYRRYQDVTYKTCPPNKHKNYKT